VTGNNVSIPKKYQFHRNILHTEGCVFELTPSGLLVECNLLVTY